MYWSHGQGILPIDPQTHEVVSDMKPMLGRMEDLLTIKKDINSVKNQSL